jgi:ERCC4-type nuclease
VIDALKTLPNVRVAISRLKLGDYQVDQRLLVERKTLLDFALSVLDGRLFSQAARLAASEIQAALILEGTGANLAASGIRREALQGALVSVSLIFGLPVLRSTGPSETARLILYAANQMRTAASGAFPRPGRRPKGKRRIQLALLQGLPGVGARRAKHLLDAFGTVEAVFRTDAEALEELPGIGRKTAQAIRWAVTEAEGEYGRQGAGVGQQKGTSHEHAVSRKLPIREDRSCGWLI